MEQEQKYKFKLELDVATGIDSFPMRTLSFGYNTLKMLRQAAARKKEKYFVLGERKYIQNDKGEYEPFAVFGISFSYRPGKLDDFLAQRQIVGGIMNGLYFIIHIIPFTTAYSLNSIPKDLNRIKE